MRALQSVCVARSRFASALLCAGVEHVVVASGQRACLGDACPENGIGSTAYVRISGRCTSHERCQMRIYCVPSLVKTMCAFAIFPVRGPPMWVEVDLGRSRYSKKRKHT